LEKKGATKISSKMDDLQTGKKGSITNATIVLNLNPYKYTSSGNSLTMELYRFTRKIWKFIVTIVSNTSA
jgi:hypothetical protein